MTDFGVSSYCPDPAKDPRVITYLVHTYSDALVRYAYCYVNNATVAEDIMEDAFAALLVKGGKFHNMEQIRAWLYKTVRNRAVDYLRRHKREVPLCDVENVLSNPPLFHTVVEKYFL